MFDNSVATFAALALDVKTWNKTYSRGKYALPEDDKEAQKLKDLTVTTGREQKYETLRGQGTTAHQAGSSTSLHQGASSYEMDIGYHSGYGQEVEPHGPLR